MIYYEAQYLFSSPFSKYFLMPVLGASSELRKASNSYDNAVHSLANGK